MWLAWSTTYITTTCNPKQRLATFTSCMAPLVKQCHTATPNTPHFQASLERMCRISTCMSMLILYCLRWVCVCAMPCADALMVVCVSAFTSTIYESFDTVLLHSTMAREHGVQVFACVCQQTAVSKACLHEHLCMLAGCKTS